MAPKKLRRKPGPPARYGRRPTLTIRLQEPLYRTIKEAAAAHGKSLSEEIEDRLEAGATLEAARREAAELLAVARRDLSDVNALRHPTRIQALREAGHQIVREAGGKITVNVIPEALETLADGILRSVFVMQEQLPAARAAIKQMADEEIQRMMKELEEVKQSLKTAVEKTLAADAAAAKRKDDDEAA